MDVPALPAQQTLLAENAGCALSVTLTFLSADRVQLHYQVHNGGVRPLYLLNQLWEGLTPQRQVIVPPNRAYVEVLPDRIKISQKVPETPYGTLLEYAYMPFMARVEPGATYAQKLTLPLPLLPYTQYDKDLAPGPLVAYPFYVELGYIFSHSGVESMVEPFLTETGETVFYTSYFQASSQYTISVGPFEESLPAIRPLNPPPIRPASNGKWTPWG